MNGLPSDQFISQLAAIRDRLQGLAQNAADGLFDGMESIALGAVKRLQERTPRSEKDGDHIADGWTARSVSEGPGVFSIEVVNVHPAATEDLVLADGTPTDYTLLEILEYGSRAHEIRPVNAKALHFFTRGGREMFAQSVQHPGTQPYNMVGLTTVEVALEVKRLIDATRRTLTLKRIGKA